MSQADPTPRAVVLSPKIVGEVRELHQRCAELTRSPRAKRGRRGRRERRDASDAENDLLRVLGFESYAAFEGAVRGDSAEPRSPEPRLRPPLELARSAPELSLVSGAAAATSLEARQTEAALLRVLRSRGRDQEPMAADVEGLHARIGACEEELAGARFELLALRDIARARPGPWSIAGAAGEAAPLHDGSPGYAAVLAELGSLLEALRRERAELTTLHADVQRQAAEILERARRDAEQERAHAHSEAARILSRARGDARALSRDAFAVVEGLRRIASDFEIPPDDLGDDED